MSILPKDTSNLVQGVILMFSL